MTQHKIQPLGPFGVEITDLDIRNLSDDTFLALRKLVVEQGVVVLRNQAVDRAAHVALGRRFGELEILPAKGVYEDALFEASNVNADGELMPTDSHTMKMLKANEIWHTDSSFRPVPASFSLFSAVIIPPIGGDTFFASLQKGWDALSRDEQQQLYGLQLVHDYASSYRQVGVDTTANPAFNVPLFSHPLVRRHPETQRIGLYITGHAQKIEGWSEQDSKALLDRLMSACTSEERVYRHHWRKGDFVIWDNRCMLHKAEGFHPDHARIMNHVRVAGTEPPIAVLN